MSAPRRPLPSSVRDTQCRSRNVCNFRRVKTPLNREVKAGRIIQAEHNGLAALVADGQMQPVGKLRVEDHGQPALASRLKAGGQFRRQPLRADELPHFVNHQNFLTGQPARLRIRPLAKERERAVEIYGEHSVRIEQHPAANQMHRQIVGRARR